MCPTLCLGLGSKTNETAYMAPGGPPSGWGTKEDTLVVKSSLAAHCWKANTWEARLVERKSCFFFFFSFLAAGNQGEGILVPKGQHSIAGQWVRAFKGELQGCLGEGLHAEHHRQLRWPSQNRSSVVRPASSWLFKVQLLFSSRVSLFPFLEASSWNCGSWCHGHSLVIMQLMSSTRWGFQDLQGSSQDMAQNIALEQNERSLTMLID